MCAIKNILFLLENLRTKTWSVCVRARSPLTLRDLTEGHRASPDICHASDQINSCPHAVVPDSGQRRGDQSLNVDPTLTRSLTLSLFSCLHVCQVYITNICS